MKHILNEIFLNDSINLIEKKYIEIIDQYKEHYFLYSNIFQMPLYYKLFTYKKNPDYNLYNKISNKKHLEVIQCLIQKTQEENYNPYLLLLLYSYICNTVLNYYIDEYIEHQAKYKRINSKKIKMNKYSKTIKYIEAQYYKERFYQPIKKHKINFKYLEVDEVCFSALDEICSKLYYFSYGVKIFKIGHKNFIKYQAEKYKGFKLLNMISAKLLDSLTRSKKYSATSIFITYTPTKKDYLNKENKLWIYKNNECYKSFTDIYNDALNVSSKLITLVSEEIFYKTQKTIEIKNLLDQIIK